MSRFANLQELLDADGLGNAGFCFDDGIQEGAIVALDPPVVVWFKQFAMELRADLGAIEDAEPEDGPAAPVGTWTVCEDDGRCWLVADDDELPTDLAVIPMRCRALSAIARELLPVMAEDWEAEPPLDYNARVEQGPLGPGATPGRSLEELRATVIPMHLTVDPWWGNLELLAFGTTNDGLPGERYVAIDDEARSAFVLDEDGEVVVGFVVRDYNEGEPLELDAPAFWSGPRFEVPTLGLVSASAGEVVLAVRAHYSDERATTDAAHFHAAMDEEDLSEAASQWRMALDAGDMKAHYALGYTLCGLGEHRQAYSHLRRYTELVPTNGWAWNWLGQACEGIGDLAEARVAYERAIEADGDETDAAERLEGLPT
jgi:tetratricopeptide (TPR) repeat protein